MCRLMFSIRYRKLSAIISLIFFLPLFSVPSPSGTPALYLSWYLDGVHGSLFIVNSYFFLFLRLNNLN